MYDSNCSRRKRIGHEQVKIKVQTLFDILFAADYAALSMCSAVFLRYASLIPVDVLLMIHIFLN